MPLSCAPRETRGASLSETLCLAFGQDVNFFQPLQQPALPDRLPVSSWSTSFRTRGMQHASRQARAPVREFTRTITSQPLIPLKIRSKNCAVDTAQQNSNSANSSPVKVSRGRGRVQLSSESPCLAYKDWAREARAVHRKLCRDRSQS